ncbi:Taurine catabolism dioxygenase TauD, TfdA family [compost metagenome]
MKDDDLGESIQEIFDRLESTVPAQRHPTILHHPATGRCSLYLNPGYTTQLVGYSADESRRLLDQIFAQVLTPGRVFNYQWEADDMLIWDNRSVWHCATELACDADRLMYRIGVSDREFFGERTAQGDVA